MSTTKKLKKWIKAKIVIDVEKISRILNKYRIYLLDYFDLSSSGAILFKVHFDGRYLILAYLLARLVQWVLGIVDREDASINEIEELPFRFTTDVDSEIMILLRDDIIMRSEKGYCLNYKRLEDVFELLNSYVSFQKRASE